METLRILEKRSRDGSTDIWMFAISICCLWDLFFLKQSKGNRVKCTRRINLDFYAMDGFLISCFIPDSTWTTLELIAKDLN